LFVSCWVSSYQKYIVHIHYLPCPKSEPRFPSASLVICDFGEFESYYACVCCDLNIT
jgi:hypothetical protein